MAVTRAEKEQELQDLTAAFNAADTAILVDYRGLDVPAVTELRRQIRGVKGTYKVVKNTLARRASKGTSFEALEKMFEGTTAIAYTSDDAVALAKALTTFIKTAPALSVKGAVVQGQAIKEIKAGKVEFRVDKTGIIHAPVGKLSFPTQNLIDNAHALVDSVVKAKPSAAKGKYLKSVTVSSTMGPGIAIDTAHIDERVKH